MKRLLKTALALAFGLALCFPSACAKKGESSLKLLDENLIEDKYDNYYEVFVYSFCDSDGDGFGDINGVTSKLDYIRDMGYTGLWLMPINPSPSYHKYDVTDYCAVDSRYGTLNDFDNLLTKAHEKGVKVITDLVVNHTSSSHPWFVEARQAKINGGGSKYINWYNFSDEKLNGYEQAYEGVYYEARFDKGMPDLNLDNTEVRAEISKVIKFWLDRGVDGFRLDACTSYYSDSLQKSAEFAGWIESEAQKTKPNAYVVGEVWSDAGTIKSYYEQSGADSFFCFPASDDGYVYQAFSALSSKKATNFFDSAQKVVEMACGHVPAPFLCNHDQGRIAGRMLRKEDRIKFAYGLLSTYTGSTFTYYGDEIGMIGSANDPDKRIGMLWDNAKTGLTNPPPGVTSTSYVFDGVKEQLADAGSILNYYKKCNNLRNAFPEIMRGSCERIAYGDENILIMKKTYNASSVTLVINFDTEKTTVQGVEGTLVQDICVDGRINLSSSTLTMPAYSIAVLK